jgi:adenylate kinase family enzyme
MSGNILQYRLIERFAKRRGLNPEQAARIWIPKRSKMFRRWFNRHSRAA